MAKKHNIQHGSIVHLADAPDPDDGSSAGPHFAIVLSRQDAIDAGKDLLLCVITKSFDNPLKDGWLYLTDYTPFKRGGHPITGLTHLSVVKGTWPVIVPQADVSFRGKRAPAAVVKDLREWVMSNIRNSNPGTAETENISPQPEDSANQPNPRQS